MKNRTLSIELIEAIEGGGLNVRTTPLDKAREYAQSVLGDIDTMLPDFDKNYLALQKLVKAAPNIKRIDMPVIEPQVMSKFHDDLAAGNVDIFRPYAKGKLYAPRKMSREEGAKWIRLGTQDGDPDDDRVQGQWGRTPAGKLRPTQNEIWFDKVISKYAQFGIPKSGGSGGAGDLTLIVTKEGYIIDGHHRWAQVCFADPSMAMATLRVPLDLQTLLAVGRSYGAALGYEPRA